MNHHDAEMSEVVVVLDGQGLRMIDGCLAQLKQLGMEVVDVNADEGVIGGNIDAGKVQDIKTVPGVCYVRSVFSYTADYPTGDPRDKDGVEERLDDNDGD